MLRRNVQTDCDSHHSNIHAVGSVFHILRQIRKKNYDSKEAHAVKENAQLTQRKRTERNRMRNTLGK